MSYNFSKYITPKIHNIILKKCGHFSDKEISLKVGVKQDIIRCYRTYVLNISKTKGNRMNKIIKKNNIIEHYSVEKELDALKSFPYKGLMFESAMHRIKYLDHKLKYKK